MNLVSKTAFRGQVAKKNSVLRYEIHIKSVSSYREDQASVMDIITDAKIFYEGKMIAFSSDLGFGLVKD